MSIQTITPEQLRRMEGQKGLVLQGCGGDPQEWLDGMNNLLTQAGILKKGTAFESIYSFENQGSTCLLFPFSKDVELDMGKLAIWRIRSHDTFGGTWLSDYVPIYLGGFQQGAQVAQQQKPSCPLIGQDGNIFNLMGIASRTLRENGMADQAREMRNRITQCQSYDSALSIIGEYVEITSIDEMESGMGMEEMA